MPESDYYQELKRMTFGDLPQILEAAATPHVEISMHRLHNETSPFVAYDLLTEMYQEEGVQFRPAALTGVNGEMKLTITFDKADDWQPQRYTSILKRFGVYATKMKFANKLN